MVRALLIDLKGQTRRVINPQPIVADRAKDPNPAWEWWNRKGTRIVETCGGVAHLPGALRRHCPFGVPGDRLWLREAWKVGTETGRGGACELIYRADGTRRHAEEFTEDQGLWMADAWTGDPAARLPPGDYHDDRLRWHPGIHMPRWAARLLLEVTDVRVERVQEISEEDVGAEGACAHHDFLGDHAGEGTMGECFEFVWDELNEKRGFGWAANPFVWAITFRTVHHES